MTVMSVNYMNRIAAAVATGLAAVACIACGGGGHAKQMSRADLGDKWPLAVGSGTIECRNGSEVVFVTEAGTVYAVNGTAKATRSYEDLGKIWADDPNVHGLKIDISALLDAGRALC